MLPATGPTSPHSAERHTRYVLGLIFVVLAVGVVATSYFYHRSQERVFRSGVEEQLSAVVELKVRELVEWKQSQLENASILFDNQAFSALVRRHADQPQNVEATGTLRTWLLAFQAHTPYEQVILLDTQGVVQMAVPATIEAAAPHLVPDALETLRTGNVSFLDFHRDTPGGTIWLSVLAPILDAQAGEPLGVLVLRIDPATYLYPFISRWPTPSETAETLLVRRDGTEVEFLSELRFQKNSALSLRIPLAQTVTPAAMAALGREGIAEGVDYRGESVIAAMRAVPNSPWFLIASMGTAEAYAPMQDRWWKTVALSGVLVLAAATGVTLVWRQQRKRFRGEKSRISESLLTSEVRYRRLFETAQDGILILDASSGMVVDVNPFLIDLLGYPREHFLNKRVWELGFFKDEAASQVHFAELQRRGHVRYEDLPLKTASGQRVDVEFVSNVYQANHHQVIQCNIRNITARVRMEEAMRSKTALLEAQSETSIDGILAVDNQGKSILLNARFGEMWSMPRNLLDEGQDDRMREQIQGQLSDPDEFVAKVQYLYAHPDERSRDEISLKDGRAFDRYSSPLIDSEGRHFGRIWFFRDITAHKRSEESLRAKSEALLHTNEELTRFVYAVSHDLKSPLVTIKTFLGYLEKDTAGGDAERMGKDMAYIRTAADKMSTRLDDLLALSRVGLKRNTSEEMPLQAVVKEALDLVAGGIIRRGVRVDVTDEPILLYGDRKRLVEVFQNLLDNAVKFMGDQAEPRVEIAVETVGGETVVLVRDNGVGIDPRHQSKLFDLFEKLDPQTEGTGLGLALARRVVEVHGGRIWVESAGAGQGTTFRFTLARTSSRVSPG